MPVTRTTDERATVPAGTAAGQPGDRSKLCTTSDRPPVTASAAWLEPDPASDDTGAGSNRDDDANGEGDGDASDAMTKPQRPAPCSRTS